MESQKAEICRECLGQGYIRMDIGEVFGETSKKTCADCWGKGLIFPDDEGGDDAEADEDCLKDEGGEG